MPTQLKSSSAPLNASQPNASRPKHLLWLASLTLFASFAGASAFSALAQTTQRPLSLERMAEFYNGEPHQTRAFSVLQQQIDKTNPDLLQSDAIAANVWRNSPTLTGHVDILSNIPAAQRTGVDPLQMALAIAPLGIGGADDIEILAGPGVESPTQVMITLSDNGLLDDSVAGIRHRIDMELINGQWEVKRAGRQVRCQLGRGHQDWSEQNCL